MSDDRLIAHLDMDAFYASVELLHHPELRGLPVVVGGRRRLPDERLPADPARWPRLASYAGRGVVTTATYEARALGVTVEDPTPGAAPVTVWSLYVPNGRELNDPHYAYKLDWLEVLRRDAAGWLAAGADARIALVGDWNVAPTDADVWDPAFFEGRTHVSPPERAAFEAFARDGWVEVTRGRVTNYTFWDYQQLRFPRNEGMRIDFVYASPALAAEVVGAEIDRNERKGKGASDHVPVVVDLR